MKSLPSKHHQNGFTIIELVVVILLLGILMTTALPRFMDVTDEAHQAVVEGVHGSFVTALGLFRGSWVAEGMRHGELVETFGNGDLYSQSDGFGEPNGFSAGMNSDLCIDTYHGFLLEGAPKAVKGTIVGIPDDTKRETAVELAAAGNPSADIIAILDLGGNFEGAPFDGCLFYYVGQYRSGTLSDPREIRIIKAGDDIEIGTFDLNEGI